MANKYFANLKHPLLTQIILTVTQNIDRLHFLLEAFGLTERELLVMASKKLRKPLTTTDVFRDEISIDHLKRVDALFEKGLNYYLDPSPPPKKSEFSIFFRKNSFHSELNFGARKIVNYFEDLKHSVTAIARMADVSFERSLPRYTLREDPAAAASSARLSLYPRFTKDKKKFLEGMIQKLALQQVLVFEFVETHNKTFKANLDGFYLKPNVIVLKRQKYMSREIFTLAHEIAHCLLDVEEIDQVDPGDYIEKQLSVTEKWCNDFAFAFLAGDYLPRFTDIPKSDEISPALEKEVTTIANKTHLSRLALYTKLTMDKKVRASTYKVVKSVIEKQIEEEEDQQKAEREANSEQPGGFAAPQPIKSPLLISTLQTAYYEGVISEMDFCKTLKITPEKLNRYLA